LTKQRARLDAEIKELSAQEQVLEHAANRLQDNRRATGTALAQIPVHTVGDP
jgi:hypothetical protein